jgi:MFS family permease
VLPLMGTHALGTVATTALPTIAPEIARAYNISPALIGYQSSLVGGGFLVALLFLSNARERWGSCRVIQAGMTLIGGSLLLALLPQLSFLVLASFGMGLGYGLMTPCASHIMMRFTPSHQRNLVFSLQQAGIPVGGILAAALIPAIALWAGWRWALGANALALFAMVAALQPQRARWDDDRNRHARVMYQPLAGIGIILRHRALRFMTIAGACFSAAQTCVTAFTVTALVEELGYGLVQAGFVLTAAQVAGVVFRIVSGWLADRTGEAMVVLAGLCGGLALAGAASFALSPAWPVIAVYALFAAYGATSISWPGAYLAEVARLSPPGRVSATIAGSLLLGNAGKIFGPVIFVYAYAATSSYAFGFGLLTVPAAVSLIYLLMARARLRSNDSL